MANLLVWILILAGATLGLLAIFLIASERELRAQINEHANSGADPMPRITFVSPVSPSDSRGEPLPAAVEEIKAESTGCAEREAECEALKKPPAGGETQETELATIRREIAEQIRLNTLLLGEGFFELQRQPDIGDGQPLGEILLNDPAAQQAPQCGAGELGAENNTRSIALTGTQGSDSMTAPTDRMHGSGEVPLIPVPLLPVILLTPSMAVIASEP